MSSRQLGRLVRRGAAWTAVSHVSVQLVQFATSVVLARLLLPEDFGVAAVVTTIAVFAAILTDLGLSAAIVQRDEVDERVLATAFWMNAALSVVLAGTAFLAAPWLAGFFGMPELDGLVMLVSLAFLLNLGVVQMGLLRRELDFRRLGLGAVIASLVTTVVSVAGALAGWGALALVLGFVSGTVATTVMLWVFVPWWPRHRPDRRIAAELWAFCRGILGFGIVNYWSRNADNILVGKFLGASALGFYGRAYNLMMVPVTQLSAVLTAVLFPALSRVKKDQDRFGRAWMLGLKASWVVGTPMAIGAGAAAPALVETLFGARWLPAATVLTLLAASVPAQMLGSNTGPLFQALGRTSLHFRLGLVTSSLTVAAIVAGLPFGIVGVATALLVKSWVAVWIPLLPALRMAGLSVAALLRSLALTTLGAVVMAGAVLLVPVVLGDRTPVVVLVVQVVVGVLVYGAFLLAGERSFIAELRGRGPAQPAAAPAEGPGDQAAQPVTPESVSPDRS